MAMRGSWGLLLAAGIGAGCSQSDSAAARVDGSAPVDLRLYLKLGAKTLSETWLYQFYP